MILLLPIVGVLGLLIGSFLNVVIARVPSGRSVVSPPSACPRCEARIRPFDNIPVLSWILLGGRCRSCGGRISIRYPLVELGAAAGFVLVALVFGPAVLGADTVPTLIAAVLVLLAILYLAAISIALALIDLDVRRLPDRIVLPSIAVLAVLLGAAAILEHDWWALGRAAIGLAALGGFYLVLAFLVPGGMGLGDVKLAVLLGLALAWLGWAEFAVGAIAAFVLGGLFGAALLIATRRRGLKVPFGPWMLAGAWVGILVGPWLWAGYLRVAGLA